MDELLTKPANELTLDELELMLADKKKTETEQRRKERDSFEEMVDTETSQMVRKALRLRTILETFYSETTGSLNTMRDMLNEYGKIKSNSKGGFHLKTKDGNHKIVYRFRTNCDWDARSAKAEDLLKDFLKDVVLKRDADSYALIMAMLEKNINGKLEYSRLQALYSQEERFDDPRWKEAIRLFKESYIVTGSKMMLEFYQRNAESLKWEPILLNLSSF